MISLSGIRIIRLVGLQAVEQFAEYLTMFCVREAADPFFVQLALLDGAHRATLAFFPELRNQLRTQLTASPDLLRFEGLRGCVKHLLGARRWSRRCQNLNDQIVEFIRHCLRRDGKTDTCELMIR